MTLAECLQVLLDLTEALEAALTRDDLPTCQRLAGDREAALEAFLGELRAAPDPLRLSMRGRLEELLYGHTSAKRWRTWAASWRTCGDGRDRGAARWTPRSA
jgi:hypothetical protein